MIKVEAYKSYPGGKSGSGTYQAIINRIPPIDVLVSGCVGNCGVTRHIRQPNTVIVNDLDNDVCNAWLDALQIEEGRSIEFIDGEYNGTYYEVHNADVTGLIRSRIAEKYDTAATLVFLDPTYLIETRKSKSAIYKHEMTVIDHELLLAAALSLKEAKVMFCAYPNGLYDEVLAGWNTYDFYSKTRNGMALERLYYNYELTDRLHDYRFIGNDFREREANNRIKNNMMAKIKRLPFQLRNSILQEIIALNSDDA